MGNLTLNGYLITNITDIESKNTSEILCLFVLCFLKDSWYDGVIPYKTPNNLLNPTWIFRKYDNVEDEERQPYINKFKNKYPDIYELCTHSY